MSKPQHVPTTNRAKYVGLPGCFLMCSDWNVRNCATTARHGKTIELVALLLLHALHTKVSYGRSRHYGR